MDTPKYYLISPRKAVQEVDYTVGNDLRRALRDTNDISFKLTEGKRRGEYCLVMVVDGKLVGSYRSITRYDMACKLKEATGIAFHHAERMLKASTEARLLVMNA